MTFTLIIALNLSLSILAMLVVYGCLYLAHRLPDEPGLDADWRDWGHPLPVALIAQDTNLADSESATYAAAA
jgi:hypothetical protein